MNPDRLAELRKLARTAQDRGSPAVIVDLDAYRELLAEVDAPRAVKVKRRLGRPPAVFDRAKAADLRRQGLSYARIARALGVGKATAYAALAGERGK